MHREYHRWFSHRVGREMGCVVYGHYGVPVLAFPAAAASGSSRTWASFRRSPVRGRGTRQVLRRGLEQRRQLVQQRRTRSTAAGCSACSTSTSAGRSFPSSTTTAGAAADCDDGRITRRLSCREHALQASRRREALLGDVGPVRHAPFMDGLTDDNFYFNNPIDYLGGLHDPGMIGLLNTCDIHIITGTGPWEKPEHSYHLSHSRSRASVIISTTGAPKVATTGRAGSTRCGRISARLKTRARERQVCSGPSPCHAASEGVCPACTRHPARG